MLINTRIYCEDCDILVYDGKCESGTIISGSMHPEMKKHTGHKVRVFGYKDD